MTHNTKEVDRKASKKYRDNNPKKIKEIHKKHYRKNKNKILSQNKIYRDNNKDAIREQGKVYREKNKKEIRKKAKIYYIKNRDKILEYGKNWKNNNKDRARKYKNEYCIKKYKNNESFRIIACIKSNFYHALSVYTNTGKNMAMLKYGIDVQAIIDYVGPRPQNKGPQHLDHKKPLCAFNFINEDGSTNLKEIQKAFAPSNHQWLTAKENLLKGGK